MLRVWQGFGSCNFGLVVRSHDQSLFRQAHFGNHFANSQHDIHGEATSSQVRKKVCTRQNRIDGEVEELHGELGNHSTNPSLSLIPIWILMQELLHIRNSPSIRQ